MDRRESLKTLLIGSIGGSMLIATGCEAPKEVDAAAVETAVNNGLYGRTAKEKERDEILKLKTFFSPFEMELIAILSDIILPQDEISPAATAAEVPDFVEFIVKDMPNHQLPLRSGLMWLNHESHKRYTKAFNAITPEEQIAIVEDIAYPEEDYAPELETGVDFFNLMRNLVLTGYYTTKIGIDAIEFKGNRPNVWDGVPADVLAEHDVEQPEWLDKCIDQSKREQIAQWDDEGNLIYS